MRPHVVIIGGGFAGLHAARALRRAPVDVTLVDRTNHHVFQPLLYQVANTSLAPSDIAAPIRWILRSQRNVTVLLGDVTGVDADDAARRALLTFVIVGGGPTGVELAGTLPEFARVALRPDFRRFDAGAAHVMLLEGGPRLLPAFPEHVSATARRDLERLGVEVRTGTLVTDVNAEGVTTAAEHIAARTVFWAAGNVASPLGRSLGVPVDGAGRVMVADDLSVPGHPEICVAGDLAAVRRDSSRWVPGVAPAAMQMGRLAGGNVARRLRGTATQRFAYINKGEMATIGRNKAVAVFGQRVAITGRPAWFFWLFVHIMYLVGFRNRLSVLLQWAYAYFTFQRGVRLVTPRDPARPTGGTA
ncbi:MAG: NAD(P)/FAD-dependent oxidoreductase [Gemmatimonadaceae bacterium]